MIGTEDLLTTTEGGTATTGTGGTRGSLRSLRGGAETRTDARSDPVRDRIKKIEARTGRRRTKIITTETIGEIETGAETETESAGNPGKTGPRIVTGKIVHRIRRIKRGSDRGPGQDRGTTEYLRSER